jgi:hypothetical protein
VSPGGMLREATDVNFEYYHLVLPSSLGREYLDCYACDDQTQLRDMGGSNSTYVRICARLLVIGLITPNSWQHL